MPSPPLLLHATAVAWQGRAVLIRGRAGSGKSALGLQLMAAGCALVADDRTELRAAGGRLLARPVPAIRGLIEARGVGLLRAEALDEAEVALLADLDREEAERLPPFRSVTVAGVGLPCLHKPATACFAAAVLQYLKGGRVAPSSSDPDPPEARP